MISLLQKKQISQTIDQMVLDGKLDLKEGFYSQEIVLSVVAGPDTKPHSISLIVKKEHNKNVCFFRKEATVLTTIPPDIQLKLLTKIVPFDGCLLFFNKKLNCILSVKQQDVIDNFTKHTNQIQINDSRYVLDKNLSKEQIIDIALGKDITVKAHHFNKINTPLGIKDIRVVADPSIFNGQCSLQISHELKKSLKLIKEH